MPDNARLSGEVIWAAGPFSRLALRLTVGSFQKVRRMGWYFVRPNTLGVHAAPVTPRGTVVLVKLTYARGWRLPGGGRKRSESPEDAILRELREEIGMTAHGAVQPAATIQDVEDHRKATASLFVVRDVEYRPKWSIEIEAVMEADPANLPPDMSPRSLRFIDALRGLL